MELILLQYVSRFLNKHLAFKTNTDRDNVVFMIQDLFLFSFVSQRIQTNRIMSHLIYSCDCQVLFDVIVVNADLSSMSTFILDLHMSRVLFLLTYHLSVQHHQWNYLRCLTRLLIYQSRRKAENNFG